MTIQAAKKASGSGPAAMSAFSEVISENEIIIGKDILELVSSAMYIDPMTIYREYVQNAADAIDDARSADLLKDDEPGLVNISVDQATRTVRIRDNGIGISSSKFIQKLTALGASAKRGSISRGFRGVGRLAGLGYAQEVVFRSRTSGETLVSELRWDSRKFKAELRSIELNANVSDVIRNIVTVSKTAPSNYPDRFFEVELVGLIRLRTDQLMSPHAIYDYLSQVAPVPFSPEFKLGNQIRDALSHAVNLGELIIEIEGINEPVYRPHRDRIDFDEKNSVEFEAVEIIEIPSVDGELAGISWIIHHGYTGALPNSTLLKGLRLRTGNIQVGNNDLLEDIYPEPRFNSWTVGEVHVIDRKVIPNGRRDHFEQNTHYHNLINHLTPVIRDVAKRCRISSINRKKLRDFDIYAQRAGEAIAIIKQGSISTAERLRLAVSADQSIGQMQKLVDGEVFFPKEKAQNTLRTLKAQLTRLSNNNYSFANSALSRLSKSQRQTYENFFELVYKFSSNRAAAKTLIDRILAELSANK